MNREVWWATVHGVAKELDTTEQLNDKQKQKSWFLPPLDFLVMFIPIIKLRELSFWLLTSLLGKLLHG